MKSVYKFLNDSAIFRYTSAVVPPPPEVWYDVTALSNWSRVYGSNDVDVPWSGTVYQSLQSAGEASLTLSALKLNSSMLYSAANVGDTVHVIIKSDPWTISKDNYYVVTNKVYEAGTFNRSGYYMDDQYDVDGNVYYYVPETDNNFNAHTFTGRYIFTVTPTTMAIDAWAGVRPTKIRFTNIDCGNIVVRDSTDYIDIIDYTGDMTNPTITVDFSTHDIGYIMMGGGTRLGKIEINVPLNI